MQHIAPTSPTRESLMPTIYRSTSTIYRSTSVQRLRRKSVGTFRTLPDLPPTISDNFQFWVFGRIFTHFRCISRFEPKCSTLPQLRRLGNRRCRPYIARPRSGGFAGSPWGRSGRFLTFPRPFPTTFNFGFSGAFFRFETYLEIGLKM